MKYYKCKLCGGSHERYKSLDGLYKHLEKNHRNEYPQDWSVKRYEYFLRTGKSKGTCIYCKKETIFNELTGKYPRICGSDKCREKSREIFKQRMIGKYGKTTLLNDPEQQKKMLANRKISGKYKWSDGREITYTGSYELDFLRLLDILFQFPSSDIMAPSPHTYWYEYNGEKHFYIPDFFIPSLNLEIEIKDGGNNANKHPKIQAIDKVKEQLKDDVMLTQTAVSYIKVTNKNYEPLLTFLFNLKGKTDDKPIFILGESVEVADGEVVTEGVGVEQPEHLYFASVEEDLDFNSIKVSGEIPHIKFYDSIEEAVSECGEENPFVYELVDENTVVLKPNKKDEPTNAYWVMKDCHVRDLGRVMESVLKSEYDENYTSKGNLNLKSFKMETLDTSFINKWKDRYKSLNSVRTGNNIDAFCWLDNDNLVGYVVVDKTHKICKDNWIRALEVSPEYRSYGLTNQLLDFAVNNLHANALTVTKDNENAINLYKKNGFFVDKRGKTYPKFYVMYKESKVNESLEVLEEQAHYSRMNKYPVFILLMHSGTPLANIIKKFTHDEFSHACISFNSKLDPLYSFGGKKLGSPDFGFVTQNTKDPFYKKFRAYYSLFVMYVSKENYQKMKERLQFFIDNDDNLKFDVLNLLSVWMGKSSENSKKYFCSRFCMSVIGAGRNNEKVASLYKPQDMAEFEDITLVNKGMDLSEYDYKVTEKNLEKVKKGIFDEIAFESMTDEPVTESYSSKSKLNIILDLNRRLNVYEYGIPKNGIIQSIPSKKDYYENYKYLSPSEFEKVKGGTCWDYVEYQKVALEKYGIPVDNYYITDKNKSTHTISVIKLDSKYYYIESSYKKIRGVYESNTLDDIFKFVVRKMYICDYMIYHFDKFKKYGCSCQYYMDWVEKHGKLIESGNNSKTYYSDMTPPINIQKLEKLPKDTSSVTSESLSEDYIKAYGEKIKHFSSETKEPRLARLTTDPVDNSLYQKFQPFDRPRNKVDITSVIKKGNVHLISDLHFGKYGKEYDEKNITLMNNIPKGNVILILGDIGYVKIKDMDYIRNCFRRIRPDVFLILGNHDCYALDFYYSLGIKGVYDKIIIPERNWVFSHQPCDGPDKGYINFHGHIHEETTYIRVTSVDNKINCWEGYCKESIPTIKEWLNDNKYHPKKKVLTTESYCISDDMSIVGESFLTDLVSNLPIPFFNLSNAASEKTSSWATLVGVLGTVAKDRKNSNVRVVNGMIEIRNINYRTLKKRIEKYYTDKSIYNIFLPKYNAMSYKAFQKKHIHRSQIVINYLYTPVFFALELSILFNELGKRYRDKNYKLIAADIYANTWLKDSDDNIKTVDKLNTKNLKNLSIELNNYQKEFIEKYPKLKAQLNLNGYILAFEQGLGKTLTAVALSECLDVDHVYIVCPNSLKENWALEIKKYYKKYSDDNVWMNEVFICNGKIGNFNKSSTKFIITNNESIEKMFPYVMVGKNMLILDESHNMRNIQSKRVQSLVQLRNRLNCVDSLIMSGTPIKASPDEITPALMMIDPTFTDEAAQIFAKAFKLKSSMGTSLVQARFGKVMYRKEKDVLEEKLPDKNVEILKVGISNGNKFTIPNVREEVYSRYSQIYDDGYMDSIKMKEPFLEMTAKYSHSASKLKLFNDLIDAYTRKNSELHELDVEFVETYIKVIMETIRDKNEKLLYETYLKNYVHFKGHCLGVAFGEILPKYRTEMFITMYEQNKKMFHDMILDNTKKSIIFSQFKNVVKYIHEDLNENNIGTVCITGDVKNRMEIIRDFKEDPNIQVLIATSQTIGTGVTLIEANQMFFFGQPWRDADFSQCCDRIHRIGQTDICNIYTVSLDTGAEMNLSTRMDDIVSWSKVMTGSVINSTEFIEET